MRDNAAALIRSAFPQGAKRYALLTPQKLSEARNRGGALGEVGVMMLAAPAEALRLSAWLAALARSITSNTDTRALTEVLLSEADASRRKDATRDRVQVSPTPENLRQFIADADRALAELQKARDAAAAELEAKQRSR